MVGANGHARGVAQLTKLFGPLLGAKGRHKGIAQLLGERMIGQVHPGGQEAQLVGRVARGRRERVDAKLIDLLARRDARLEHALGLGVAAGPLFELGAALAVASHARVTLAARVLLHANNL